MFKKDPFQNGSCNHDFIEVSGKRFCGNYGDDTPLVINSETNSMMIKFVSDRLFRYSGFKCRYRAMSPNGVAAINSFLAGEETKG